MGNEHSQETRMRVLIEQLNRAHGALANYRQARMRSMAWGSTLMLVLLMLGYSKWAPMAALALPFVAVFLVVHYGYLTHLVTFSRAFVGELENKINKELGETVLISESLEAKHSGFLGESHFLGVSGSNFTGIFSVTTVHYLILCLLMFLAGALHTQYLFEQELMPVGRLGNVYSPFLLLWALANILYLIWYFVKGEQEKGLIAAIRKEYQQKSE